MVASHGFACRLRNLEICAQCGGSGIVDAMQWCALGKSRLTMTDLVWVGIYVLYMLWVGCVTHAGVGFEIHAAS